MAGNNPPKTFNRIVIKEISASKTLDELSNVFRFVKGLANKIRQNINAIISGQEGIFNVIREDLLRRITYLDKLGISINDFFTFFESDSYWQLKYSTTEDHIRHTNETFPDPVYYPARQFIDYSLFPTYYFRKKKILEALQILFSKASHFTFLDAGTGSGELALEVLKVYENTEGYGCDVLASNFDFIARLLSEKGIRERRFQTVQQDVSRPFHLKDIDLIICSEVLEHVEDPKKPLTEFHKILKPGGYVIITVPLKDPGHEHIQEFKSDEDFLSLLPKGYSILEKSIHLWNGYQINTFSGNNTNDVIQHLFLILQKNGHSVP